MEINETVLRQIVEEVLKEMGTSVSVNEVIKGMDTSVSPSVQPDGVKKAGQAIEVREKGPAQRGQDASEVVVGISPAFGERLTKTIIGIPCDVVLRELLAGIEENEARARLVRVVRTADLAFIGHEAAKLSGSGVGIGVQMRGSTVIHHKDLLPLSNLELFPQSPVMTPEVFRAIGGNAARYAKGDTPAPVLTKQDPMARPRYQAKSAVMHTEECKYIVDGGKSIELEIKFKE